MILLNGKVVDFRQFPDGTAFVKADDFTYGPCPQITWRYDDDRECMQLYFLVNHINEVTCGKSRICLDMPYIPNARMDRVKSEDDVFTLKWFCKFINSLNFASVSVLDPHSNVASALIDRVQVEMPKYFVETAIGMIDGGKDYLLCFPDEGAAKRYSSMLNMEYVFGIKHRDWKTGKILGLSLTDPGRVEGRDVLIVDDICSRGGTFTAMAKALKDAGAQDIQLYISHCENTIFNGSVLTDGLISHVYTTDSIYRGSHPNITIIE